MNTEEYFEDLDKEIKRNYSVADSARAKGLDPSDKVEVPLALTMASKVIKLVATLYPQLDNEEVITRLLVLEKEYGALEMSVAFKIADEIAHEKFCKFENQLQAIEAGIRVGFAYVTLGVVASPIEGFTELKLEKTADGKDYFKVYFSGPIRSAGTTASCVVLMLIDYLRQVFGYARYDPTENEIKRMATELFDYHDRITNLQYCPTEEEILFLAKNMPIQVAGDPTERVEVSNYKDLPRVETNFIRGGLCLIMGEGLAQKAKKGLRLLKKVQANGFKVEGWEFLDEYLELHDKRESGAQDTVATYIKDLVAGRPVYGHPGKSGSFRFRYGRSNTAGFSAVSIHPATMGITDGFLAAGTQLKIEKPTKGCIVMPCDSMDGPIVKLKSGSVRKFKDVDEARKIYPEIEEIIYLGDMLFPLGDVINRNAQLPKPGFVEEWWKLELKEKGFVEDVDEWNVDISKAIEFSKKYDLALHPSHIFYWNQINVGEFLGLIDWLQHGTCKEKIILPYTFTDKERFQKGKRALELLGVEHEVTIENVVISEAVSKSFLINLGFDIGFKGVFEFNYDFKTLNLESELSEGEMILKTINELCKFEIKDKAGDFIGARMGRPEKAKLRRLTGNPNVLFTIGSEGGRLRSVQEACEVGKVKGEFPIFYCKDCNHRSIYRYCDKCFEKMDHKYYCWECDAELEGGKCEVHNKELPLFKRTVMGIPKYLDLAVKQLGISRSEIPKLIKGVRGTTSAERINENLAKGILRAKFNLAVNKDGTVRYDVVEMPLSHFKPLEVETSVEKLKELGYDKDVEGNDLVRDDQILELKPHDIVLSCNVECGDEKADDVFMNLANFLDDLLIKFYKLPAFYNIKKREDLVGHLTVCMAPHNCAGVISRIIGFTKVQGLVASPYMHAAMRRDCDGDEAAVMMLLDVLINFSRKYLPGHRGGTQDAPLVLNGKINPGEVDDQILDFELVWNYPLELYHLAEQRKHSSEIEIEMVKQRMGRGEDCFVNTGFTHNTTNFNKGINCTIYKTLPTMVEKVEAQMDIAQKLRSVDTGDVARLVIERHFIRDMRGNLRKFSQQKFRCVKCNEKFRRPPLSGKCTKCSGKIIFTISEGGIVKYLALSMHLAEKYAVPVYVKQNVELTKRYIESIFGREKEKQEALGKWFS